MGATLNIRFLAALVLVAEACAPKTTGGNYQAPRNVGTDGGTGPATGAIDGLLSLSVSPGASNLTLFYASPIVPAAQSLVATGSFKDGSTKDLSKLVAWGFADRSSALASSVNGGAFVASAPGRFIVSATAGTVTASATLLVKLTGDVTSGTGVANAIGPADKAGLDGAPGAGAPTVAYPLDGALFPLSLVPLEFQMVPTSAAQTLGRVAWTGDLIDLRAYGSCTAIPAATSAGACALSLPDELQPLLAAASEGDVMSTRVRLAGAGGAGLVESAAVDVRWSSFGLGGGLYYWSAAQAGAGGKNKLMRYNLDRPGAAPETYFTDDDTAKLGPETKYYQPCFGCHAVSQDGTKIALTYGGSVTSQFALLDVATKAVLRNEAAQAIRIADGDAPGFVASAGFATQTTFSPDGATMVQAFRGRLIPRLADATLADVGMPLFTSTLDPLGEKATQPYWANSGTKLAFASWQPSGGGVLSGDLIPGSQIWIADVAGTSFGVPMLLVPRQSGKTEFYPALSDDAKLVVWNESRCDGPQSPSGDNWGQSPCDGYDDPSATLRLIRSDGGSAPVALARANGEDTWTNSWPRFSPSHGRFRGKDLYWIAFSSRRPYGARLPGSNVGNTRPQLWFTAVAVDPSAPVSSDPSFAPIWLPAQNEDGAPQRGNHVPQWVSKAVAVQ